MIRLTKKYYSYYKYLIIIAPFLVIWFILSVLPNLQFFPLSFYNWSLISEKQTFVGFENYRIIFNNPTFLRSVKNTLFYILFLFTIQTTLSLPISIILQKNTRSNKAFRALFFTPMVFSSMMIALTWSYMYDSSLGMINKLLVQFGFENFNNFNWLGEPKRAILCIVIIHIWANIGYPLTIITASLNTVPEELYEAVSIDGCSKIKEFIYITFPLILPVILRITMLTIITGALAFDYVFILGPATGGNSPFDTLSVLIYKSLVGKNMGLPSAYGVILGVVLFTIFLLNYKLTKIAERTVE